MLSPRALEREAKIVARRLFRQKAWLERRGNLRDASPVDEKNSWVVVSAKTRRKSKAGLLSGALVKAMQSESWLNTDPTGALRLSAAGLEKFINPDVSINGSAGTFQGFSEQHQQRQSRIIKDPQGATISVVANETESPLGWMRA